jgi:hypothetical protein
MVKLLESGEGLTGEDAEDDEDTSPNPTSTKEKAKSGGRKKPLPSTYEPDARSQGWLKVKKDYLEGVGDTLDLIPIGAWHGLGRKAGWWSPILLAAYNPDTGALEAVCKCLAGKLVFVFERPELGVHSRPFCYQDSPMPSIELCWTSILHLGNRRWLGKENHILTVKQEAFDRIFGSTLKRYVL